MSRARFAGIVLSAGDSRRMGRPKAGLDYGGQTFLARAVHALADGGVAPLVVVAGRHREAVAAALPADLPVELLHNPEPDRGQLSSLKIALLHLQSLAAPLAGAAMTLVDHPAVRGETVAKLLAAVGGRDDDARIAVPRFGDRRGHPVVFARDVWSEILATPDDLGARAVVRRVPERVRIVDVDDPGVLVDVDTPDDLARAIAGASTTEPRN